VVEAFEFDPVGNLVSHQPTVGPVRTPELEVGRGNLRGGVDQGPDSELWLDDGAGRTISVAGPDEDTEYEYDGLGRLRRVTLQDAAALLLHYDASGDVHRREHDEATGSSLSEWILGPWRHDERTGATTEKFGPLGHVEGGARRWTLRGAGGQVEVVLDDSGAVMSERELRPYGTAWEESGPVDDADGLHGMPFDRSTGLILAGLRAFRAEDGQWLQPEPLLLKGLVGLDLADPQASSPYRYGRNAPTAWHDTSGAAPARFAVRAFRGLMSKRLFEQARSRGVARAWRAEFRHIFVDKLPPTAGFSAPELAQLEASRGSRGIRGWQGHHIKSVKDNTIAMAEDPENIKFVRAGADHLAEHRGNYRNETTGALIKRGAANAGLSAFFMRFDELYAEEADRNGWMSDPESNWSMINPVNAFAEIGIMFDAASKGLQARQWEEIVAQGELSSSTDVDTSTGE
jgi:RHS repeat-associated protein